MAADIDVSIAMQKLTGAFRHKFVGKTATRECICIPIDELSEDRNGNIWLNVAGYTDTKFERQLYSLKQKLSKAQYDRLPVNETTGRKEYTPYIGSIRRDDRADSQSGQQAAGSTAGASANIFGNGQDTSPVDDDLPF